MPVRGMHHSATDVQRRADDAIGMEPFDREDGADDVDNRVERADFVEMDLVDWNLVNSRFRFSKVMKQLFRASLRRRRQGRALDQLIDFGEAAVRVLMRGGGGCMPVVVLVIMPVCMIVPVCMVWLMMVRVLVGIGPMLFDDEFGRRDTGAQDARRRHLGALEGETSERAAQLFERQPRIEKRAKHHVARGAVETVEV